MADQSQRVMRGATSDELRAAPVAAAERLRSMDALRGLAVLGILAVNIGAFALPDAAFYRPSVAGGFTGANFAVWLVIHVLFEMKFITIFSMLFGAGVLLMGRREDAAGVSFAGRYYRRLALLLVFGLIHSYVFWYGDILVTYALMGAALYPMRRLRPEVLIGVGAGLLCVLVPGTLLQGAAMMMAREGMRSVPPEPWAVELWSRFYPSGEQLNQQIALYRGAYGPLFWHRLGLNLEIQIFGLILFSPWRVLSVMMIGLGMAKMGVFAAAKPGAFYAKLAMAGYGVGLPLVGVGLWINLPSDFDIVRLFMIGGLFNLIGGVGVALGHVGLFMLLYRAGVLKGAFSVLSCVGRMAFTNYLSQTVICTFLFYGWSGYGFGWFGSMDHVQLAGVVACIWAAQLIWSPLWLRFFAMGPMEWVWRVGTYGRLRLSERASS